MGSTAPSLVPAGPIQVSLRGRQLIDEPRLNQSTAFPLDERDVRAIDASMWHPGYVPYVPS